MFLPTFLHFGTRVVDLVSRQKELPTRVQQQEVKSREGTSLRSFLRQYRRRQRQFVPDLNGKWCLFQTGINA